MMCRYGFNSEGHQAVFERIKRLKDRNFQGVVGVNLGKNKTSADPIQDYVSGIQLFGPVADYLVINISRLVSLRVDSLTWAMIGDNLCPVRATITRECAKGYGVLHRRHLDQSPIL